MLYASQGEGETRTVTLKSNSTLDSEVGPHQVKHQRDNRSKHHNKKHKNHHSKKNHGHRHGHGHGHGHGHDNKSCLKGEVTVDKLISCVTEESLLEHLRAFQDIADNPDNFGGRATGNPGFDDSVDYVVRELKRAGYKVEIQESQAFGTEMLENEVFQILDPNDNSIVLREYNRNEFAVWNGLGAPGLANDSLPGIVTGMVKSVGDGCLASDFDNINPGDIALLDGLSSSCGLPSCDYKISFQNALNAGASGGIFLDEYAPEVYGIDEAVNLPFVAIKSTPECDGSTYPSASGSGSGVGDMLRDDVIDSNIDVVARIVNRSDAGQKTIKNVIAETSHGNDDNMIVIGAHLDSVLFSPGINDNAAGVAIVLELAKQLRKFKPNNKIVFAFWGGEEGARPGLDSDAGSNQYLIDLFEEGDKTIAAYLNIDVPGSQNYLRIINYMNDTDTAYTEDARLTSSVMKNYFVDYFTRVGLPFGVVGVKKGLGGSDHLIFGQRDIGYAVVNSIKGASQVSYKALWEANKYGGEANALVNPFLNVTFDTYDNFITQESFDEMGVSNGGSVRSMMQAAHGYASVLLQLAYDTKYLNGISNNCPSGVCADFDINTCEYIGAFENSPTLTNDYYICPKTLSWTKAEDDCVSAGGHLARIDSSEENNFIRLKHSDVVYIGLNDKVTEGNFVWSNEPEIPATFLNPMETPNNNFMVEHCVIQRGNGSWNDTFCGRNLRSVCEIPANPQENDSE